jgi:phage FluMu protein Com
MKAICADCNTVMFECSSTYLCDDFECPECGAVNSFDNSKEPTKIVSLRRQVDCQTIDRLRPRT